jgi:hypothetical protein
MTAPIFFPDDSPLIHNQWQIADRILLFRHFRAFHRFVSALCPQRGTKKMIADSTLIAPDCAPFTSRKSGARTRLLTLSDLDGRTSAARAARVLLEGILADLGGADSVSAPQRALAARAAALNAIADDLAARALAGDADAADRLVTITNALRRLLRDLSIDHRSSAPDPQKSAAHDSQ